MRFFVILLSFVMASAALASCPDMLKEAESRYQKENPVTSATYAAFSKVMKHYRSEIAQDSDFKPYIESSLTYIKGRKVTGFEIVVSMGGDEDTVRYVLNEKKEMVVGQWYNQSPMIYWFCGKETVEAEYWEELENREY